MLLNPCVGGGGVGRGMHACAPSSKSSGGFYPSTKTSFSPRLLCLQAGFLLLPLLAACCLDSAKGPPATPWTNRNAAESERESCTRLWLPKKQVLGFGYPFSRPQGFADGSSPPASSLSRPRATVPQRHIQRLIPNSGCRRRCKKPQQECTG